MESRIESLKLDEISLQERITSRINELEEENIKLLDEKTEAISAAEEKLKIPA